MLYAKRSLIEIIARMEKRVHDKITLVKEIIFKIYFQVLITF